MTTSDPSASNTGPASAAEALRALLAFRPHLVAFVVAMIRDIELAERIYQEVCVAVGEEWESYSKDEEFNVWARKITLRKTMAWLKAREESMLEFPPDDLVRRIELVIAERMATPEERWKRQKEALRVCFRALPERLRTIVDLRYLHQLSADAIAECLGEERDTILVGLLQARKELERCVALRLQEGHSR